MSSYKKTRRNSLHILFTSCLSISCLNFQVNSSTKTSYYQQLVSVATDEETKTTSMINLGQMQHKVTVTPQWEPIVKGQLQQAI